MPSLPTPAEAEGLIRDSMRPLPVESRPLASLSGAVLAQPVHAERDQPPFDRVAMDGIAIATAAWRSGQRKFRIAGTQAAGQRPLAVPPSACVEAMTGAVLPTGSDCVIPVERIAVADGEAAVQESATVEPFANVHRRGTDSRAGELLLEPGTLLGAPEIAVLATAGLAEARVRAEPRIMIVATGDELVEPGEPVESWQIRSSNSYALAAALKLRGRSRVATDRLRDDPAAMRERLAVHLAQHDLLLLSGGVSAGRYDHVPGVLRELGVRQVLHKVAQRPGMPLWFGVGPSGQAVFGLPGNPVSSLVCLVRYVLPAIRTAAGMAVRAVETVPLGEGLHVKPALWYFLPVRLDGHAAGGSVALPRPTHGSGDFVSLAGTDGFVELPPGPADYAAGHVARFYRW